MGDRRAGHRARRKGAGPAGQRRRRPPRLRVRRVHLRHASRRRRRPIVTVLTQPTDPVQKCAVTAGQGTATSDVVGITVACATVAYPLGGTVYAGLAATDAGGGLHGARPSTTRSKTAAPTLSPSRRTARSLFPSKVPSGRELRRHDPLAAELPRADLQRERRDRHRRRRPHHQRRRQLRHELLRRRRGRRRSRRQRARARELATNTVMAVNANGTFAFQRPRAERRQLRHHPSRRSRSARVRRARSRGPPAWSPRGTSPESRSPAPPTASRGRRLP